MITHYLKLSLRNISKDRIYSLINLIGLSLSIACCFLLIFWIKHELSFDNYHPKAGCIYKILETEKRTDGLHVKDLISPGIAHKLKESFPEIEAATMVSHETVNALYEENEGIMVDFVKATPDYLDMFSYEYIEGNKENVLNSSGGALKKNAEARNGFIIEIDNSASGAGPNGVIMSEETAKKFFGEESAIGKTVNCWGNYIVQAVVKIPPNSHVKFDILNPNGNGDGIHYIQINEKARFTKENRQRMSDFLNKARLSIFEEGRQRNINMLNEALESGKMTEEQATSRLNRIQGQKFSETENTLTFLPLKDVHLFSPKELAVNSSWQTFGDLKQIYLFSIVAFLILVIAIINYFNTSTARAMNRMREVGIRKVNGSTQKQLVLRFLSDSFILSAISIIVALLASKLLFTEFSLLIGNQGTFLIDFNTVLIVLATCAVITLLSGGYAAFYLSSFNPVTIMRGGVNPGSKENMRKILVGFQFFLSIGMLITTSVIYKQIHYLFTTDTGVDRNNIIIINTSLWYGVDDYIQLIKRENPNIIDATIAWGAPYNVQYGFSGVSWEGSTEAIKETRIAQIFCDYHYANTFGLEVIEGEFIQPGWSWWQHANAESFGIVINEAFKKFMGVDNPVGITVNYGSKGKIIGVVKDFNFRPLKEPITPLIFCFNPESSSMLYIKTTGKNKKETLDYITEKYREMGGVLQKRRPFAYATIEEEYNAMYKTELRTMKILTVFSMVSLFLSILGIIGMVSYMVEKRTKEIAIRKINGAEVRDIISLFISEFTKIIGVASAVAIPVSFFILFRWMQTYAFQTGMSWWIFVLAALVVFLITSVLIAVQVYLTTRQNPADIIKSE